MKACGWHKKYNEACWECVHGERASGSLKRVVRRAAAKTLNRLKRETVLRPIGSICFEEWQEC
jgi:hypothetical protein